MNLLPDTYHIQQTFSTYCRTGEKVKLPGVAPHRLKHYRQLVFNMIQDTMEHAFPIAFKHIATAKWNKMGRNFFEARFVSRTRYGNFPWNFILTR